MNPDLNTFLQIWTDGSTTPLWTSGKDTRAGKFKENELFKDVKIRAVSVSEVGD